MKINIAQDLLSDLLDTELELKREIHELAAEESECRTPEAIVAKDAESDAEQTWVSGQRQRLAAARRRD